MDIIFVTPPGKGRIESPQYGCLWMASVLRNEGYNVGYVDGEVMGLSHTDFARYILKMNPTMVGVSANTLSYSSARKLILEIKRQLIKKRMPTVIVLGGVHATFMKEICLEENPSLDVVVVGEGFYAMKELLEKPWKKIRGLIFQESDDIIVKTPSRPLADINELPIPAWDLVDLSKYSGNYPVLRRLSTTTFSSIGCPHRCVFCSLLYKKPRFRKPEILIEELKILVEKGAKEIFLYDDEFNLNVDHAMDVCDAIISSGLNKRLSFKCQMRSSRSLVTRELLKRMKEANFTVLMWGVESGSQEVLDAIQKDITVAEAERALQLAYEEGLLNFGFFMTQNYEETWKEMLKTASFIQRVRKYLHYHQVTITTPYPGSVLWRLATKKGWLPSNPDFSKWNTNRAVMSTPWMSRWEAERARIYLETTLLGRWQVFRLYLRRLVPYPIRRAIRRLIP